MKYRVKPPDRMLKELEELDEQTREFRFGKLMFFAVDNILGMGYLQHFFKHLAERGCDYEFFYEIKANLDRHQIETLYRGGVRRVQPGIESLNTDVLNLMRKGIRGIANINTLRWLQYYGIEAGWNILWGFPGETVENYISQEETIRKLVFLRPPVGATRISAQRFSPIFNDRDSFPVRSAKPQKSYSLTYPENVDLDQIAYFFRFDFEGALPDEAFEGTRKAVHRWRDAWESGSPPTLTYLAADDSGAVTIEDHRNPDEPRVHVLESSKATLFVACSDRPRSISKLESALPTAQSAREIEDSLEELCSLDLMHREDALFLTLPLPAHGGHE
jgi:ribosomal peptide maturation radical SAM protein 1